jgi:hypothetical protein
MKQWLIAGSMVGAILCGAQATKFAPIVNPPVRIVGLEAQDTHAAASLLGQFRTSFSALLYLRADLYVHGGVEMRPLTHNEELHGRTGASEAKDEAEKLDGDAAIVTVIPSEKEDFRGIFGDVERRVASYKDMSEHHHQSPTQTLPLFRLMTWIDPQFIEAWTSAGQIILWENKKESPALAVDFLKRGLDQNPESIDILTEIAYCWMRDKSNEDQPTKKFENALPYLLQAKKVGLNNLKTLTDKEANSLKDNYRKLCICYRELHQLDELRQTAEEGLKLFGADASLKLALAEATQKP